MLRCLLSSLVALFLVFPARADLAKIDRIIAREPKYTGKPQRCLVVFGPDLKDRVWLVRDGDVLYADKNGNGDLTDPGERIAGEKDGSGLVFHVGTIRLRAREHRNVVVRAWKLASAGESFSTHPAAQAALRKDPGVEMYNVSAEVAVPGLKGDGDDGRLSVGARMDVNGPLFFGDDPRTAPVLHFGGPLHIQPENSVTRLYRAVPHDFMLTIGTPGIGPGTFATVGYDKLVPQSAHIVVEAEFAPIKPGDPPVRQKYELKDRC
jgi:hypothetical protein